MISGCLVKTLGNQGEGIKAQNIRMGHQRLKQESLWIFKMGRKMVPKQLKLILPLKKQLSYRLNQRYLFITTSIKPAI